MWIKKELLDEILKTPEIFGAIYAKTSEGEQKPINALSFTARLKRGSEVVTKDVAIADYFRDKGYTDEEIFEQN